MNKALYFSFVVLLFLSNSCFAQIVPSPDTLRIIQILQGRNLRERSIDSVNKLETIAGDVILQERLTKFSCDSAIINRKDNTIEAFGNVHINDADSLHTYSQYLKYFGNERLAHLTKNVKLTDKKGTLLTQDLQYDLGTGIGTYRTGGKVINGSTVLTSRDGIYHADTKDVYFKNNVDLVDPKYKINADSLLYNTQTQVVTFIGPTNIKSKQANIYTTQGYYDLKNGNAFFGTRSLVTDSSRRIYQSDQMAIDENAGLAELEGNAVIKDSANGVIVTANHIYLNNKNSSFLAVNKPVMIIQQEKDSIYISADTLFSGFTTVLPDTVPPVQSDSAKQVLPAKDDGSARAFSAALDQVIRPANDTTASTILRPVKQDSIGSNVPIGNNPLQSTGVGRSVIDTVHRARDSASTGLPAKVPPLADTVNIAGAINLNRSGVATQARPRALHTDSARQNPSNKTSARRDTVSGSKGVNLNKADSAVRYFLAFHHVRIFNDSLQSVCDSLFFSAKDSVFRLFRDPVVWSGESQVTGDTIYLYTENKKPSHLYVFNNGMVVNRSDRDFYNQVAGKTINAYFKEGSIDYARVKGQKAESIYYVKDNDSAYVGMNNSAGDVIDMFFLKGELNKVKFINDVSGTMYPMRQIPADKKFLKSFQWLDKRRPKNKFEIFE